MDRILPLNTSNRKLAHFNSLEAEIIAVIEATDALKESPDYELYQITEQVPEVFERVVEQQIAGIDAAQNRGGAAEEGDRGAERRGCGGDRVKFGGTSQG